MRTQNKSADRLAQIIRSFFEQYLRAQRNVSAKTVLSYRDTLKQFLRFTAQRHHTSITALAFERLDVECILAFLDHIENDRKVCIRTRNQRMAALRSFFRHAATMAPEYLHQCRSNPASLSFSKESRTPSAAAACCCLVVLFRSFISISVSFLNRS